MMLPTRQEDCFSHIVQDFLICTTVHKARQLGIHQGEIMVRVTLDKESRHTKYYANSENPYFNEYFVFEIHSTLMELLRLTILYEVKKRTKCTKNPVLGTLFIDMQSVWNQPNRCYFKKWGSLEVPIGHDTSSESVAKHRGYLQIDLAIVSQASVPSMLFRPQEDDVMSMNKWQIHQDYDDISKNLLQSIDSNLACNTRYTLKFYRGHMVKKSEYLLQFRFHPFKGKTIAVKSAQPVWNQEITFSWIYPSLAQTFLLQLLTSEHMQWKCIAEYELHFDEIAFKAKPALGPTYIHLYDNINTWQYVGRILMEIKSECLRGDPVKEIKFTSIVALEESLYWFEEFFIVEFLSLQGDFIQTNANSCKLFIRFAEHQSNYIECNLKSYKVKPSSTNFQHFAHNVKYFRHDFPSRAVTVRASLPDNRLKFYADTFLQELLDFMEHEIQSFKLFQVQYSYQYRGQVKVLRAIILSIINRIQDALEQKKFEPSYVRQSTIWDNNRSSYLKDYFDINLKNHLKDLRNRLRPTKHCFIDVVIEEILLELTNLTYKLKNLLTVIRVQDNLPDLILVLMVGNKEIGICRLDAKQFFNPRRVNGQISYSKCWKMHNFVFKDTRCQHSCLNCGCVIGTVQGCLSVLDENERQEYLTNITDWSRPEPLYWSPNIQYTTMKGRIFVHQGKIRPGSDQTGLCDPYVRITIAGHTAETAVLYETLSPIWNSVISFEELTLPGPMEWYIHSPPLVLIEVYDTDRKTSDDYLGCGYLPVSVIFSDWADSNTREEPDICIPFKLPEQRKQLESRTSLQKFKHMRLLSPPPLKWIPMVVNGGVRAEILISGELVEVSNNENDAEARESIVITTGIPTPIRPIMRNFVLEVIYAGFRNYSICGCTLTSRHRIKVMMGDLLLTSGLSMTRIKHSINFLVLYSSGVVSLPEQLEYWPSLIATDVVISSNGTEITLGAATIPDSKRFLRRCEEIKCFEPQEEVQSMESTFVQIEDNEQSESDPLINNSPKEKLSLWKRIFSLTLFKNNQNHVRESYDLASVLDENSYNWWTKFYNSIFTDKNGATLSYYKHRLYIYHNELEKEAQFSYFTDWAEPLAMVHGVKYKRNAMPKEQTYATLKLHVKITPCKCEESGRGEGETLKPLAIILNPKYQAQVQALAELVKIVVRVYIVQGIRFRPKEKESQADSYIKIQFGQKQITNRAQYVPNESNPIFGKCFDMEGVLPREHILEVSAFNRNKMCDDVIGSTFIDLEDRWRTKHRATVGLSCEYASYGYNKWRDYAKPSEILHELCVKSNIKPPRIFGNIIEIDGVALQDETKISVTEDMEERLSLTALHNLDRLPSFKYKLVPEHVETRSLYNVNCPGIEQGKIQLWIELFDANLNIPPPIDITPEPPKPFELRVIVYQCSNVILQERNIFGKPMSDIYFKGWCSNADEYQLTDVHYRSLNGEGQFNWRMIFPFKYSLVEDMMVIKRRKGYLDEYEMKQPPKLFLQVFDKDIISFDDFLGTLEIHLSNFVEPTETSKTCRLENTNTQSYFPYSSSSNSNLKLLNLFRQKKVRGWFPLKGIAEDGTPILAGKVELELEILSDADAANYPAGLGRSGPQPLPPPVRPHTSFHPLLNPLKSLRKIILPSLMKYLIIAALVALSTFALILYIMQHPFLIHDLF